MTTKIGNGSMPLRFGRLINTDVYGGPIRDCPVSHFSVKMASEIDLNCDVSVPTEDFNVPIVSQLQEGVVRALMAMMTGRTVYAGCWGGIGRTGLFLAALAKVQIEYRKAKHRAGRGDDPVLYVRKHFIPHAVETKQQMDYIADFDVSTIVDWMLLTQNAMGLGGMTPASTDNRAAEIASMGQTDLSESMADRQQRIRPAGVARDPWIASVDKIDNPAFDKHARFPWKSDRTSEQINTLVERDLDWMDHPEADSAFPLIIEGLSAPEPVTEDERMELAEGNIVSLETCYLDQRDRLGELVSVVDTLQESVSLHNKVAQEQSARITVMNADFIELLECFQKPENPLTKQSWRERIRTWLATH